MADGPYEAGEFACKRCYNNRRLFAFRDHGTVASAESGLCLPCNIAHTLRKAYEDLCRAVVTERTTDSLRERFTSFDDVNALLGLAEWQSR